MELRQGFPKEKREKRKKRLRKKRLLGRVELKWEKNSWRKIPHIWRLKGFKRFSPKRRGIRVNPFLKNQLMGWGGML